MAATLPSLESSLHRSVQPLYERAAAVFTGGGLLGANDGVNPEVASAASPTFAARGPPGSRFPIGPTRAGPGAPGFRAGDKAPARRRRLPGRLGAAPAVRARRVPRLRSRE